MSDSDTGRLLRDHDLRVTPQRRAIVDAFRGGADEHLAAEEVLSRASSTVPDLGRGTVYATLAELAEVGVLASVGTAEPIRYELNVVPHDHFRCRVCLRLFDIDLGGSELAMRPLLGYTIQSVSAHAEGTCADCASFARGIDDGVAEAMGSPTVSGAALAQLSCAVTESPLGDLGLVASAQGVVHLAFTDHADFAAIADRAGTRRGPAAGRVRVGELRRSLDRYFGGDQQPIGDVIDWQLFSEPERRTMLAVQGIPYARPLSYDRIISELEAYELGRLMGVNPLPMLCPCHRVRRGIDELDTWVGGLERLRFLNALESGR